MTRRMFSTDVVKSDDFIDISITARLLYFYLGLDADNEGFVNNPKSVARSVGITENITDLLNELIDKHYIIPFDSRVYVITHWKVNNVLDEKRMKKTIFTHEKSLLSINNNVYIFNNPIEFQGNPSNSMKFHTNIKENNIKEDNINKINECNLSKSNISECNASKENINKEKESAERENHTKVANNIDYDLIVSLINKITNKKCSLTDSLKSEIDNAINHDYQFIQKLENFVNDLNGQTFNDSPVGIIKYIATK